MVGHAAENGADAGQEFAGAERLADVVVGADLKADDAVGLGRKGCEEYDGDVVRRAQLPAKGEAVFARHHDIENNEIEAADLERTPHRGAIGGLGGAEAVCCKETAQAGADLFVVIDNENVGRAHGGLVS